MEKEKHYITKSNWLRAAVLGANDGILSVSSLAVGVAAASPMREPLVIATLASLVAGALSMAAGEYVSVSSQLDIETADIDREKQELINNPEGELQELVEIYKSRGLDDPTAHKVAEILTEHDALGAHTRDELGITDELQANPFQAALASGLAFIAGGILPMIVAIVGPMERMVLLQYVFAIVFLGILGTLSAKTGGTSVRKAVFRLIIWGTLAMALTALVGYLFGVNVG